VAHVEFDAHPDVSQPVMVCAFGGWNDGGEAATTALRYVRERWGGRPFARVDPEEFFDFQVNRPLVHLEEGDTRSITWPTCEFSSARPHGRDVVLFSGVEPNVRWRTFTGEIVDVARMLDVELLVTMGAFLADVPHTLPAPVTAASTDPAWIGKLGIQASQYEGPTGIVGVLHDAANRAHLPSVSLWAAAPHYLPAGTNPKVALSLLGKLSELLEVRIDTDEMAAAAAAWEQKVREALEEDENLTSYVGKLEELAAGRAGFGDIPTGDQLATELERYLREQRGDGEG
jgi:predicted ATP-grasp superfamily ATP-dependent carboligase